MNIQSLFNGGPIEQNLLLAVSHLGMLLQQNIESPNFLYDFHFIQLNKMFSSVAEVLLSLYTKFPFAQVYLCESLFLLYIISSNNFENVSVTLTYSNEFVPIKFNLAKNVIMIKFNDKIHFTQTIYLNIRLMLLYCMSYIEAWS